MGFIGSMHMHKRAQKNGGHGLIVKLAATSSGLLLIGGIVLLVLS